MMECSSIQYLMSHTRRRRAASGGALVTSHQAHSCNHRGSRTRNPFLIPAPARPSPPQPRAGTSCKSHPNLAWNNIKYRIENICWAAPRRGRQWSVARASCGHVSLDNSINCTGWSSIHGICTQGLFSISTYLSSACGLSPNSPSQREKFLSESFIIKSLYLSTYLSIYCHVFYNLGICRYRTYPKCSLMRPPPLTITLYLNVELRWPSAYCSHGEHCYIPCYIQCYPRDCKSNYRYRQPLFY